MRCVVFVFVAWVTMTVVACAPLSVPHRATTYLIEEGKSVPGFDAADPQLAEMALAAWSRASGGRLKFARTTRVAHATIRIRWISPDEGLFGEMERVTVNGKPGAIVNVLPAVTAIGGPFATMAARDRLMRDSMVYLTCLHELGHALGLGHTRNFDDIMYSFSYGGDLEEYFARYRRALKSRADIPAVSGLSTNDVAALQALFGEGVQKPAPLK